MCSIYRLYNTQVDNARDLDVLMAIDNLIEYSGNSSKTSGSIQRHCRNESVDNITHSKSLKLLLKFTNSTDNDCTVDVEIGVPLEYQSVFSRTLAMVLINSEINLVLT